MMLLSFQKHTFSTERSISTFLYKNINKKLYQKYVDLKNSAKLVTTINRGAVYSGLYKRSLHLMRLIRTRGIIKPHLRFKDSTNKLG